MSDLNPSPSSPTPRSSRSSKATQTTKKPKTSENAELVNSSDRLLVGLNEAQRAAVAHKDGPLLVLAGPGSGKTRVVTHRVAWLLENGVRDGQIAALTFTNKAADEMKTRLAALAPGNRVWIGTFHRFCAFLLRYYAPQVGLSENYAIYDVDQSRKLLEELVAKRDLPNGVDVQQIASAISWAKNSLVAASEYCAQNGSLLGKVVEEVYPAYQEALKKANAVDFDDLLFHVAVLLKENPEIRASLDYRFKYILVDEYQDTNLVQYAIARALSIDFPNLAVTGDPDQSIYGWRGANIQNILNFEQDFEDAKVVRLEQNYRSDKRVLRLADALIKHNVYRKDKELRTDREEGVLPRILQCLDQREEAEAIAAEIAAEVGSGKRRPRDYAVFYRMNALSRNLEYALKRRGVPFQLVRGLEFFNRKEVKDVCAYLQLIYNRSDVVSFRRVVNLPARGVGRVSLARLEAFATQRDLSLFEAARSLDQIDGLSTRVRKGIAEFVALIDKLGRMFEQGADLELALGVLLEETKYVEYLQDAVKTEEDAQRLANIQELLSEAREFDADFARLKAEKLPNPLFPEKAARADKLGSFLEQIALVNDVDSWDANDDRVSLMTLHAAKGLEFPVVYLIALEEGVLPHERSTRSKPQLEEERRLLFVGLTRAEEELRLSRTRFREFRGSFSPSISSRFLFEFPNDCVESFDSTADWLRTLEEKAAENPRKKIVVPQIESREDAAFRRPPIWEEGVDREPELDVFRVDGRAASASRKKAAPRRASADFADADEFVDPEPIDDFSQENPENELEFDAASLDFDAVSQESTTDAVFEETSDAQYVPDDADAVRNGDYDGETEIVYDESGVARAVPSNRRSRKKATPKPTSSASAPVPASKRPVSPNAISPAAESADDRKREIAVNSFVRHRRFGVGVVKALAGPSFDRVATVAFLSGVGEIELSLNDAELSFVAVGRSR